MDVEYSSLPMAISPAVWKAITEELEELRIKNKCLAEECRKSRAILGPFGTLREGIIQEDGFMYEDARRATDAAKAMEAP